jgi:hypothetical protein
VVALRRWFHARPERQGPKDRRPFFLKSVHAATWPDWALIALAMTVFK